jgi:hypothetical protein
LYPVYSLEPGKLHFAGRISQNGNSSFIEFLTQYVEAYYITGYLDKVSRGGYFTHQTDLGLVNMPVWEMIQQIAKCKNAKLFFK